MLEKLRKLPNLPILIALLAADLMYFVLHIFQLLPSDNFPFFQSSSFAINQDAGVAESFQYLKVLWITLAFLWLVYRRRCYPLLALALLFGYLLLDDMIMIHERLGDMAAGMFAELPVLSRFERLAADDFGELFVVGLLGMFFVPILGLAYWRSNGDTRSIFNRVFVLFALLLVFAVGVDFLNGFFPNRWIIRESLRLLEDGGEMLVTTAICWFVLSLVGNFQLQEM